MLGPQDITVRFRSVSAHCQENVSRTEPQAWERGEGRMVSLLRAWEVWGTNRKHGGFRMFHVFKKEGERINKNRMQTKTSHAACISKQ